MKSAEPVGLQSIRFAVIIGWLLSYL